jgi:hypothetical protein
VTFSEAARKEHGTNADPPEGSHTDLAADWRSRIPADLATRRDAWAEPDAWDGTTTSAGMEMPDRVVGVGRAQRGRDPRRGTSPAASANRTTQTERPSPPAWSFIEPISQPGAEDTRAPAFGAVVAPSDEASPPDRLVSFTGRDPEWTAR